MAENYLIYIPEIFRIFTSMAELYSENYSANVGGFK